MLITLLDITSSPATDRLCGIKMHTPHTQIDLPFPSVTHTHTHPHIGSILFEDAMGRVYRIDKIQYKLNTGTNNYLIHIYKLSMNN